jgi:hypothetical protein
MGWGDEIMALGRLEAFHVATGERGSIRGHASGEARENILWQNHPAWEKDAPDGVIDGGGFRPYIERWTQWRNQPQIIFNRKYRARAGKIHLTPEERAQTMDAWLKMNGGMPFAIISPHIKDKASPNKQWGLEKWEKVIVNFPLPVYQLSPEGNEIIKGARWWKTRSMREAAAVVALSKLVLTNEGGLHHLAAAMNRPAVVVFGAFISPEVTGYSTHENLSVETEEGYCGRYAPCDHCKNAMAQITPDMVKEKAMRLLGA